MYSWLYYPNMNETMSVYPGITNNQISQLGYILNNEALI